MTLLTGLAEYIISHQCPFSEGYNTVVGGIDQIPQGFLPLIGDKITYNAFVHGLRLGSDGRISLE